jgi:hypothetical protein
MRAPREKVKRCQLAVTLAAANCPVRGQRGLTENGAAAIVVPVIFRTSIFILVLLTLLGHVCELPIAEVVAAHAHAAEDQASDHHHDGSEQACDAVLGVKPPSHASCTVGFTVNAQAHPFITPGLVRGTSVAVQEPDPVPRPLPLFLLHAALLI